MGRFSLMAPVEPKNWASPKVKTPPSGAATQYPDRPPLGLLSTVNQSDRIPKGRSTEA